MALDQGRNWKILMAESLARSMKEAMPAEEEAQEQQSIDMPHRHGPSGQDETERDAVYLPDEIIVQILDCVSQEHASSQTSLASCSRVSHQWYRNSVPLLYHSPRLYGHNFDPFVATICPSKNLTIRVSRLASLVRTLDMSALVHQATKSTTARLLGRTKGSLQRYIAPQRGFAMNAFPALAKASNLHTLDLSLVSESPPLPDLFKALAHLANLRTFRLPRSAGFGIHHSASAFPWPPNLTSLSLSGGIDAHFLHGVVSFPQTLRSLTIEHCPTAKGYAVTHLLRNAVAPLQQLRKLRMAHLPRLSSHALDGTLFLLPQLESLSISVDYITPAIFDENHHSHIKQPLIAPASGPNTDFSAVSPSPADSFLAQEPEAEAVISQLRTLELTYSGSPADITDKVSPLDIMIAMDDCVLPKLLRVRVAQSLMWTQQEAESLSDALMERAEMRQREEAGVLSVQERREMREAGVYRFEG